VPVDRLSPSRNPISIRQIDHVVLRVSDVERAIGFYVGVLGCREERRLAELGLVQLRAGASLIDLVPVDSPLGKPGGAAPAAEGRNVDHVALRVERLDSAVLEHLGARGVQIGERARRYGAEGMGWSIYVRDPDDNVIELRGDPDGGAGPQD
jgi:catechol 2,3-dioxygenase-like lactoylglutathione lyase family enzyme